MKEYKILHDTPDKVQRTLNQWRHQYLLDILNLAAAPDTVSVVIQRTPILKDDRLLMPVMLRNNLKCVLRDVLDNVDVGLMDSETFGLTADIREQQAVEGVEVVKHWLQQVKS